MKSARTIALKALCFLCMLCGPVLNCLALDREAFSISSYDLNVQIDPEQHRLGARGKITLRNDSSTPQKIAILQISSSLDWRSIKAADKPLQLVTQPYTSDIDHTGSLSEAIVTLPQAIAPHATIDLEVGYEGVVLLDATRLTRIDTPEDVAKSTDWDQISPNFTAIRGIGHVAWYPIATEVANLSEGNLFETIARWEMRESGAAMHVHISATTNSEAQHPRFVVDEPSCTQTYKESGQQGLTELDCIFHAQANVIPTFVFAEYGEVGRSSIQVFNLPTHAAAAVAYADAAEKLVPLITEWFGPPREKAQTADLPDPNAAPFEGGAFRLMSLGNDAKQAGLAAAHQLTHAAVLSPRPWIHEGLAHFAQALSVEQEKGRQAALDYMAAHRTILTEFERTTKTEDEGSRSLVNTTSEELYRSKAMCVWWMLRDMLGDSTVKKAIAAYKPDEDKDASYMPRLIAAQTPRDLGWFFDDWVYRDHGLPDFKVESAFTRATTNNSFVLTITLENSGSAGAEVPVLIKTAHGEVTKRIEVRAKSKATVRVETPAVPQEIVVNDGSVPEQGTGNNTFKVEPPKS